MRYKISCAILAGGRSSRMGKDKALLEVNGKKLVQRVHEKVKNLFSETIVIANKPDALTFLDIPIFPDLIANLGPLGGIYTALKHSSFPQCLVIACDLLDQAHIGGQCLQIKFGTDSSGLIHGGAIRDS